MTHKMRPMDTGYGLELQVQDVWYTLQGEGPFSGMPAVFVRLTGCNLACHFCDTAWDDNHDPMQLVHVITQRIVSAAQGRTRLVVITGGEPLRQRLWLLIHGLGELGFQVQVETNGTYWQACLLEPHVTIVCSPKAKHVHPKIKEHCQHWKYVVQFARTSIHDGLPAGCCQVEDTVAVLAGYDSFENKMKILGPLDAKWGGPCRPPEREGITVWLSPCDEHNEEANARNRRQVAQNCLRWGYRAQVQLHKILNVP